MTVFRVRHVRQADRIDVVEVGGDLDASVAPRLAAVLDGLPRDSAGVVVDLDTATLIDANAVALLLRAARTHRERGVELRVAGAGGPVLQVLEVVGVAKSLGAYLARDEALAAVTGAAASEPAAGGVVAGEVAAGKVGAGEVAAGEVGAGEVGAGGAPPEEVAAEETGARERGDGVRAAALAEGVHELLHAAQALPPGDPRRLSLRERAVEQALPYARKLAARYRFRGEPVEDLCQVAAMGLVKAVNGYRPERTTGFLGYATPTILGELRRHFRDTGWTVRVPRRLQELRLEVNRAAETLTQALGRRPGTGDLASFLGVAEAEVIECLAASQNYHPVSLSTPTGPDDTHELADAVGAEDPALALVEYRQSVGPLLASLTPHEREVVALRFFGEMTQSQIAARVGSSQMHVSRLLTSVLGRLRGALADETKAGADDPAARPGAGAAVTRSARPRPVRKRPQGRPGPAIPS